jgi:multiple sugar transport system permease protein
MSDVPGPRGGWRAPASPAPLPLPRGGATVRPTAGWRDRLERPGLFQWQLITLPILALLCFQVIPILHGFLISLQSFTPWSPEGDFVGLRNYGRVLTNPLFYRSALPNTFLFLVLAVGLELTFGLGIALLINRPFPGARVVKTLLLFPLLVAPVVAGLMFYWMFHSEFGLVNQLLEAVGLPGVLWFNRPWTAFGLVVLADVWTWFTLLMYSGRRACRRSRSRRRGSTGPTPGRCSG